MKISKYIIISALSALWLPAGAFAQDGAPEVVYLFNNAHTAYFQVSPDEQLEQLTLDLYTDVRTLTKMSTVDLLGDDMALHAVPGLENVYGLPIATEAGAVIVYRLKYQYAGGSEVTGPYCDGGEPFVYMTDLGRGAIQVGWGNPFFDIAYNGTEPLRTLRSTYAKGYGIHGPGSVETPTSVDLSQFSRFCADVGGQIISNPTRGNLGFQLLNGVDQPFQNTGNVSWQHVAQWDFALQNTAPGKTVKIVITNGGDGNTNDVACIGAPRFYYHAPGTEKAPQTIEFDSPGRTIFDDAPEVTLSAFASGGTPVFYSIIQGADIATLEGNVLRPKDGYNGEIVVEAMTLGDRNYAAASATQTYTFRFGPAIEYLYTHKNGEDYTAQTVYIYVDPRDKELEKLSLDIYDNVRSFQKIKSVDLIAEGLEKYAVAGLKNVYGVPVTVPTGTDIVHRLSYKYSDEEEVTGRLSEGKEPFIYMTDPSLPPATIVKGWGNPFIDIAYNGQEPLRNTGYTYAKGYGLHGAGYVETNPSLDLSQFTRFSVDVGGQVISNPSRGRVGFALYNGISQPYLNTGNVNWNNVYEWDFPLQSTAAGKTVKVQFTDGGDGNMNDVVCIGAPRFYYAYESLLPQSIDWIEEEIINNYVPFTMPLTASASSGLPVIYRVVRGGEYARIENGSTLRFYNIPSEGEVVVEAYQPGSKDYEPSETAICTFRIRKAMIIQANERKELLGGNDIDELVIYGNTNEAGQAVVKDGIVNVKKLVLKYTFRPGQWNYISFPSDLDLESISDLRAKGFSCASEEGTDGTYVLREYNTRQRAEKPSESPWTAVTSGKVTGLKGYIMKLESADDTPVEITFNIDNVALDFDNTIRNVNIAVDMSKCEPETRHTVYVRPTNVKGNTLRIDMRYVPLSREDIPLNHSRALEAMRVTRTQDGDAIRLTLPEQTPAKVAIFDRTGEKLLKAVRYVSPMKIDVSDLDHGAYRMVVIYGPASIEKEIEL